MGTMIVLSFALYALYVLLPLVPAVVIFKLFPKTSVSVSGPLQNFTINATGAFGAYLVTVLLGYFLVNRIDTRIDTLRRPVLTYEADLTLLDEDRKPISDAASKDTRSLEVSVLAPRSVTAVYPKVFVTVPLKAMDEKAEILLSLPGFQPKPLILSMDNTTAKPTDSGQRTRVYKGPVELQRLSRPLLHRPYEDDRVLAPADDGPPIEMSGATGP
jgi:hypothetical protein